MAKVKTSEAKPTNKSEAPAEKKPAKAEKPSKKSEGKPAAKKTVEPNKIVRELGHKLRKVGNVMQIDFGYFDMKQNGFIVGQVVVSQYVNGGIIPGTSMEYYYLYVQDSGQYRKFTWPSKSNSPQSIEFVYQDGGPGPSFDPVQYQYQQPVGNQLISCTCVNMGVVYP
jgi:hypothetical protein